MPVLARRLLLSWECCFKSRRACSHHGRFVANSSVARCLLLVAAMRSSACPRAAAAVTSGGHPGRAGSRQGRAVPGEASTNATGEQDDDQGSRRFVDPWVCEVPSWKQRGPESVVLLSCGVQTALTDQIQPSCRLDDPWSRNYRSWARGQELVTPKKNNCVPVSPPAGIGCRVDKTLIFPPPCCLLHVEMMGPLSGPTVTPKAPPLARFLCLPLFACGSLVFMVRNFFFRDPARGPRVNGTRRALVFRKYCPGAASGRRLRP